VKTGALWQLSVATTAEAEEAVADLLGEIFHTPASAHFDALKRTTTVSVFLAKPPAARAARHKRLRAKLRELADCGLDAGPARVRVRKLPSENWAESWKRHFKPIEVGGALLIKPGWSRRKPKPGQALVVLDPGLSFGTGQHATTGFCLRELVARRKPGTRQSFLDAGTGSGILAIAAAKLGYAPVHAFDFDSDAVRVARANARQNRVFQNLRIECRDVARLPAKPVRQYDLVCANLLSTLLIAERRRLAVLVRRDGALVLAGILRTEFAQVQTAYEALGMRLLASRPEREWRSGSFGFRR
jgi:ribosomal protein L11 methyltransferase